MHNDTASGYTKKSGFNECNRLGHDSGRGCPTLSGNYVIRSKDDVTHYFVVNTWGETPKIYLIRRNSEDAEELAEIDLPKDLRERFLESVGHNKGVYSIEGDVKDWLKNQLDNV